MTTLLFASNNEHKAKEIQAAIGNKVIISTLKQAGIQIDIPEPYDSLEANALEKVRVIYTLTGKNCMAEDTGLEVAYLKGEPGVKSARYAGVDKSFDRNNEKLLLELGATTHRGARFRTIMSLLINKKEYTFEGICEGHIGLAPQGHNGFGYDCLFIPAQSKKTFAEMTIAEKSQFSHRRKACDKLVLFLQYGVY
ncbi:MAG: RdgB/HAM1 family non-canonical purine NTP pyrophosphatase [Chitinophagaceae bacterium]